MFNYDRNIILIAYRAKHSNNLDVKESTLTKFDADLFTVFEDEVRKQATEQSIPINDFNRSMLVCFATQSGAETVKTKVKHACTYFLAVRPQP